MASLLAASGWPPVPAPVPAPPPPRFTRSMRAAAVVTVAVFATLTLAEGVPSDRLLGARIAVLVAAAGLAGAAVVTFWRWSTHPRLTQAQPLELRRHLTREQRRLIGWALRGRGDPLPPPLVPWARARAAADHTATASGCIVFVISANQLAVQATSLAFPRWYGLLGQTCLLLLATLMLGRDHREQRHAAALRAAARDGATTTAASS